MKLVVDASVAIKWVVAEEGRTAALARTAGNELVAPEFALVEVANVLWKKVRIGQLDAAQARSGVDFIKSAYSRLVPTVTLVDRAMQIAIEAGHPVYDCLYLACAEQEDVELLTADHRFAEKTQSARISLLPKDAS